MKCILCEKDISKFSSVKIPEINGRVCEECGNHINVLQFSAEMGQDAYNEHYKYLAKLIDSKNLNFSENAFIRNKLSQTLEIYKLNHVEPIDVSDIKVTTTFNFEGYNIIDYRGIVSAETVLGTGLISEVSAFHADLSGSTSNAFEEKIEDAKENVIHKVLLKTHNINCNAIIGFNFNMSIFSGNLIAILATGTAVIIEKT